MIVHVVVERCSPTSIEHHDTERSNAAQQQGIYGARLQLGQKGSSHGSGLAVVPTPQRALHVIAGESLGQQPCHARSRVPQRPQGSVEGTEWQMLTAAHVVLLQCGSCFP